jgi:NAD+ synthase (glutamine-hydrolysing)
MRVALAQINVIVGDLEGNQKKIIEQLRTARQANVDIIAFPELCISGYPPEDLLLRSQFIHDNQLILNELVRETEGLTAIVGFVDNQNHIIYNAAAVLHDGHKAAIYHKINLPNYGVFDEKRYFKPGNEAVVLLRSGTAIGISICEDIWIAGGVIETEALQGDAAVLINISSSPFHAGKGGEREKLIASAAQRNFAFVIYVNLVGGQDELVFDGRSMVASPTGDLLAQAAAFDEELLILDLDLDEIPMVRFSNPKFHRVKEKFSAPYQLRVNSLEPIEETEKTAIHHNVPSPSLSTEAEIYKALLVGIQDYVHKNGFEKVAFGLSGGIDSALTAVVAVDALSKENVISVAMPSQYSSEGSIIDARRLAENLGIEFQVIPIESIYESYKTLLAEQFADLEEDVTEENIQARIRGNILMALANKFGYLVLATGNKSEVSVGYCTIYGDMVGGFSVLKDVPKTMVYRLAEYRNAKAGFDLIPRTTIEKVPSAELRPNQLDQDSLPPYDVLDSIIEAYVEKDLSLREIVALGFEEETVLEVIALIDRNEYKRRQAAPGIKITPRAFGKDRRMPITNRYRSR